MPLSEGSAEPSMLLIRNCAWPIHTHLPQWENVNSAPISRGAAASVAWQRQVGVVRVAFPLRRTCWVGSAGLRGPVAGNTRGQARIGDERTVKGNQIAQAQYVTQQRHGDDSRSVGGFGVNRYVRRHEEWGDVCRAISTKRPRSWVANDWR
jgi:hypothetical protein